MVPVVGRPAARGTWHVPPRKGLPKIFEQPYRSHGGAPLIPNSQVTRVLHQLKIHWGCRSSGVPAARARGEEAVLTWGPPVKVNFELATPNSVHGCTLARPTWRRMIYWAGVHCARAVHVQVQTQTDRLTLEKSHAPTGQMGGATDLKIAGHMHTVPT